MYCKHCGTQIDDEAKYCPSCGAPIEGETPQEEFFGDSNGYTPKEEPRKATFKEGIVDLFKRFFVFNGESTRSLFNYGILFIMLTSFAVGIFASIPVINSSIEFFMNNMDRLASMDQTALLAEFEAYLGDSYVIVNVITNIWSIATLLLIAAPICRRLTNIFHNQKLSYALMGIYCASGLLDSILSLFNLYSNNPLLSLLDFVAVVIFVMCVFMRPRSE